MQNERKRILTMLENGTISMEEALTLLETMEKKQTDNPSSTASEQSQSENVYRNTEGAEERKSDSSFRGNQGSDDSHNPSMDEFIEDIRKDFVTVGDRFMQFMQTAVDRMKKFDFDTPFGGGTTFSHTMIKAAEDIEEIIIDVDHGNVTVETADVQEIRAEFTVKNFNNKNEEETKKEFLDKVVFVQDEGTLRLLSDLKLMQVNVTLLLPNEAYHKASVRLLNGDFTIADLKAERIYVKTANGKVEANGLQFDAAELETANGSIRLNGSTGAQLSAETINGRVYIDGALKDVEAKSLNGAVVVTTTDKAAEKIEAKTVSGSVEIYIPSELPLDGHISTNMGKLDLQLNDVDKTTEQEQFLQRSVSFKKHAEGETKPLHIQGEAKTGTVIVCYNVNHSA